MTAAAARYPPAPPPHTHMRAHKAKGGSNFKKSELPNGTRLPSDSRLTSRDETTLEIEALHMLT